MNISVNWLRDLVPGLRRPAEELARRLSMVAVPVEEVVEIGRGLSEIRVARVLEARPHPDADRLTLCRVDGGGGEPVEVVCGAPDVEEGALYPWVPPGASLPGGMRIASREIRGRTSHGMLCSERELALGTDAAGILRLPDDLPPGLPLDDALLLPDHRLVLELTPNRVDLACHVGVARELAPGGTAEVVLPHFEEGSWEPDWREGEASAEAAGVRVTVEDPGRCDAYLAAVVRGVRVGPSPCWLAARLRAIGARPVNNVVDATNYVLHELNQPLHAFDLGKLAGERVVVRAAREGEGIRTLDGVERRLEGVATVIADAEGPVALAGVMGGEESEVTGETVDVLLECASFHPGAVRRTARETGLATDASYRFERGVDRTGLERALVRCVELVLTVAGGRAEGPAVRVETGPREREVVELRPSRVRRVLGRGFGPGELRRLLDPLGFEMWETVTGEGAAAMACRVPGWRRDVTREIDLVEEVARRHGYENFPTVLPRIRPSSVPDDPSVARARRVRELMHARGFLEAASSPLASRPEADPFGPVELLRPLSAEEGFLRGSIVAVLLRRLEHNFNRGEPDVRLYEVGTVFRRPPPEEGGHGNHGETVGEETRVGVVMTGRRRPEHWADPAPSYDLWDLKGLAEEVAGSFCGARLEPATGAEGRPLADRFAAGGWLGAERFGILRKGVPLGVAGGVRPEAVDAPPWASRVWALEFRLAGVEARPRPVYRPLSGFPPVRRDLALTVPEDVEVGRVEATVREAAPDTLEALHLFDVYRGEGVERGRRSLAFRFRFRAPDRTLRDEEADEALEGILKVLEERHDARVRSG